MAILNGDKSVAVYDKITGSKVSFPGTTISQFFTLAVSSGPYANQNPYPLLKTVDPRIIYDHHHQRWIASAFDTGSKHVLLAVSIGSDPVGNGGSAWVSENWKKYLVPFGINACNTDYDTLGVDANGIRISVTCGGYVKIATLPKASFLNGSAQPVQENFIQEISYYGGTSGSATIHPAINFDSSNLDDRVWFVFHRPGIRCP